MKQHHLKQHIGYWLNRLRTHVHQAFEQRLKSYDVTVAQWCVLVTLYDNKAESVKELSDYIEIDKASISRVIDRLVTKKLVKHTRGKDRRSGHIELTKEAKQLVPQLIREAEENEHKFFRLLTDSEAKHFKNILKKILSNIPSIAVEEWLNLEENTMPDTHAIANILKRAKTEQWTYPKTFELLKEAGVQAYEVNLAPYKALYNGTFGTWEELAPEGLSMFAINKLFNRDGVIKALKCHQRKETTYTEFLKDIASAGIMRYAVDMRHRHVTYYGRDSGDYYREEIPTL